MQELWNVGMQKREKQKGSFRIKPICPTYSVSHCHVLSTLLCAREGTKITPPDAAKNCHFSTYTSTIHSSTHASTCQLICPSPIHSSTHLSTVHPLFTHLPTHPSTYPSTHSLIHHASIYTSIHPSTHPFTHLLIQLSTHHPSINHPNNIYHPTIHPSICPHTHLPIHPPIHSCIYSAIPTSTPFILSIVSIHSSFSHSLSPVQSSLLGTKCVATLPTRCGMAQGLHVLAMGDTQVWGGGKDENRLLCRVFSVGCVVDPSGTIALG